MNAYELADELQKFYDELDGSFGYLEQSINILRQQADRIAELEKLIAKGDREGDFRSMTRQELIDYIEYLRQCIDAPQTKPLSEKELYEVFDKCYPNNGDGDVVTLVDFARAIEERHGIK